MQDLQRKMYNKAGFTEEKSENKSKDRTVQVLPRKRQNKAGFTE